MNLGRKKNHSMSDNPIDSSNNQMRCYILPKHTHMQNYLHVQMLFAKNCQIQRQKEENKNGTHNKQG